MSRAFFAIVALLQAAGCGGMATAFVAGGTAIPMRGLLLLRSGCEAPMRIGLTRLRGDADNAERKLIRVVGAVCLKDGLVFMAQRSAHKVCDSRTWRAVPRAFMWQRREFWG